MVVVRFSLMFDKVRSGGKRQTIRPYENYQRLKVGDKIHCYSTKKVPYSRRPVLDELLYEGVVTEILVVAWGEIRENDEVARLDGFEDSAKMREWFERYEPTDETRFRIIRWR